MGSKSMAKSVANIFKNKLTGKEKSVTFRSGGAFGGAHAVVKRKADR